MGLLTVLSASSVAPKSLELGLELNMNLELNIAVPDMERFSKAKTSFGAKRLMICTDKLEKLKFILAREAEVKYRIYIARNRVRRRLFRQTRSSASEAELKSELFADFSSRASTPNERMLETSYNCQVEFELGKAQTEECKTIIEFVASNGEFLKTEKENSRMVRNAYKWNKNDQRINKICCDDECNRRDEAEIKKMMQDRRYRKHLIDKLYPIYGVSSLEN